MLAHLQGTTLNAAQIARGLGVDGKTVARYLDLLVDLLLVRRLPPFHANVGKRLVKSPVVRDGGLVHALLRIGDRENCSHTRWPAGLGGWRSVAHRRSASSTSASSAPRPAPRSTCQLPVPPALGDRDQARARAGLGGASRGATPFAGTRLAVYGGVERCSGGRGGGLAHRPVRESPA
jgi:hypothetical protein